MAFCCPSVAERYNKKWRIPVNYLAMCGGWVNGLSVLHGIRVLKISLPW
jgi:hypothetical protein